MKTRTNTCGELNTDNINKSVTLNGWVNTVRLHGQVVFVDLRDRYGKKHKEVRSHVASCQKRN